MGIAGNVQVAYLCSRFTNKTFTNKQLIIMKKASKLLLMAIAYLATFILGAASGAIHPACYAYAGVVLPLLTAFIYLYTCTLFPRFGAATILNGFIVVLFLIVGEADIAFVIGMVVLTALAEIIRKANGYDSLKGVRWSFIPFAFSFFAYTAHWWTDTEGSLAAAVEEMPAGYDQLMLPVINNIPVLIVVLALTVPIAIMAMWLATKAMRKQTELLK